MTEARPLRALTLRQPWASAITELGKNVENRTWHTTYRGPLLIHAGLRTDPEAVRQMPHDLTMPAKAVLAVARITGTHADCGGKCSTWALPGHWHWQIADILPLPQPIPTPGRQGLWIPDDDLRRRVASALPPNPPTDLTTALRTPTGGPQ
ncbi:hypothetical protein [Streptomyces uncialis]|uniref:hypothetical protein n=1 Tax=Streptomyces uncialis TaxID=1048205 RepID=UPI00386D15B6|nr:hypothetical protein OG924_37080 [Streptomyces uncialis]